MKRLRFAFSDCDWTLLVGWLSLAACEVGLSRVSVGRVGMVGAVAEMGLMAVGGLAVDFGEMAQRAVWRDDVLEVELPAASGNAASFLRRPEIAARLSRVLSEMAGRPVRQSLVIDAAPAAASAGPDSQGRAPGAAERGRPAVSQAAMLREASEHPLVMHVRTLFDAAVRKVEPPRPRPSVAAVTNPSTGKPEDAAVAAVVADDDERDHAAGHDADGTAGYGGIDG